MNKLIKSQRESKNTGLNLQVPPALTQTSVLEDSNFGSPMVCSPSTRRLKKKQSLNSKFSKFDLNDRSQFGQAEFEQIQNQWQLKDSKNKKQVGFQPQMAKESDRSFLRKMPLFKQFQEDHNFSQIQFSQIPKNQNYQCDFQEIVSPRKLKRQTSFHETNIINNEKQLRQSQRKKSFQIITQQSNSGSHNSSVHQSKKLLLQSKSNYKAPKQQLEVMNSLNKKYGSAQLAIEEASFENSKFEQSKIDQDLQALKQNHTIQIQEVLSQKQEQILPKEQKKDSKKNSKQIQDSQQKSLQSNNKINYFSKVRQNKNQKNQTSSSSSSIPSPKLVSFSEIQTPKFPKENQLVSKLRKTCLKVLNIGKGNKQDIKQNNKNFLNINQNQQTSSFSLKIQKVPTFDNKNLSTVFEGHENQSRFDQDKTFILADQLKINSSCQTDPIINLSTTCETSEDKIKIIKQDYSKTLSRYQEKQQAFKKEILNLQNIIKSKQIQNKKNQQQNNKLRNQLNQKENKLYFSKQQIQSLKQKLQKALENSINKNFQQQNTKLQKQASQSYKLSKKEEQWSYLQFKYQKQIKSLQLQLYQLKKKILESSKTLKFNPNQKNEDINKAIEESIQFLKYHQQALYQNMIKIKKQQDAILRQWRELDRAKRQIKSANFINNQNSYSQYQRFNRYY